MGCIICTDSDMFFYGGIYPETMRLVAVSVESTYWLPIYVAAQSVPEHDQYLYKKE